MSVNIAIYIYDNAEVLDFSGPYEVFATASRITADEAPFKVFFVAESPGPVIARAGFSVNPQYHFQNHPDIDVLIVAGGVHHAEMHKTNVIRWIQGIDKQAQKVTSVCTGAFLLAEAGLLNGLKATTHWDDIAELRERFADVTVLENQRWVDQGKYLTSAGISAGIDMSLYLVSQLGNYTLAVDTARQMEYDWHKQQENSG